MPYRSSTGEVAAEFEALRMSAIRGAADADIVVDFAERIKGPANTHLYVDACCFASWALAQAGRHVDARIVALRAQKAAQNFVPELYVQCRRYVAFTHAGEGDHNTALRVLLEVERDARFEAASIEDQHRISVAIGLQYRLLGDWTQAYPILTSAVQHFKAASQDSNWYALHHLIESYLIDLATRASFFADGAGTGLRDSFQGSGLTDDQLRRLTSQAIEQFYGELRRPIRGATAREIEALGHLQAQAFAVLSGDLSQVNPLWKRIATGTISTDFLSTLIMVACAMIRTPSDFRVAAHQLDHVWSKRRGSATVSALMVSTFAQAQIAGLEGRYEQAETFAIRYLHLRHAFSETNYGRPLPTSAQTRQPHQPDSRLFEAARPAYLRKAMAVAADCARAETDLSSADLARMVGVSERTLRGAFEFYEHMTPSEFLEACSPKQLDGKRSDASCRAA